MRTDVHRPSSPLFDPQAYRLVGVFDTGEHDPFNSHQIAARRQAVAALVEQGYRFGPGSSSQCGHCGAHIRYTALMVRDDVKEFIFVGQDCLDNRFDGMTKAEFQRLRKAAKLNRERETRSNLVAQFLADHPGLEAALAVGHYISDDLRASLDRYGNLSDKQVALAFKIQTQVAEQAERERKREEERAALVAQGVKVVPGRYKVTGTILSYKTVESPYGAVVKMLVQSPEGWKVWGTVPRSIEWDIERDQQVTFVATVTPSDDDPTFGFYSRPTNAAVLATA